jgi:phage gpG-like protein
MKVTINDKDPLLCSMDELQEAMNELTNVAKYLQHKTAQQFHIGQTVKWHSRKNFREIEGIVDAINRTSISLHEKENPLRKWRVSPTLLKIA